MKKIFMTLVAIICCATTVVNAQNTVKEKKKMVSTNLQIGVMPMEIDGFNIRLYDVERCVCDAVKFRNKIGMDVCSGIIGNYLERPNRNLSKLMSYARKLRVGTILEQYLQVKL